MSTLKMIVTVSQVCYAIASVSTKNKPFIRGGSFEEKIHDESDYIRDMTFYGFGVAYIFFCLLKIPPTFICVLKIRRWLVYRKTLNNAKNDVISASHHHLHQTRFLPMNGKYECSYYDSSNNITCYSEVMLRFVKEEEVSSSFFCITGSGKDNNGEFVITEGKIAQNGKAYWIEKSGSWWPGLLVYRWPKRVVNHGTFSFYPGEGWFDGFLRSNNGLDAKYIDFSLETKPNIILPVSSATTLLTMASSSYGSVAATSIAI